MVNRIVFFSFFMLSSIYWISARPSTGKSGVISNGAFNNSGPICCIADSTEKELLEQLSRKWMDAMISHDTVTLKALMSPEYKLQRWDGSTPVFLETWMDNLLNHIKIIKFEQSGIYAEVHGDVALVTSLYTWTGSFNEHLFDSNGYIVDTWVRNNNSWQVVSRTNGTFAGSKTLDSK